MDWNVGASVLLALAGGLAVAAARSSPCATHVKATGLRHVNETDFLNLEAQVTAEIPEGGLGRISLIAPASGARVSPAARSANGERIPFGTAVRVVGVGAGAVTVVSLNVSTSIPSAEWPERSNQ
jgi:hypothetical protein